jgi:hypothetical protein
MYKLAQMSELLSLPSLPIELFDIIASFDIQCYRAVLHIPIFGRSLITQRVLDFKIIFGYSIKITSQCIEWFKDGQRHGDDGPAVEYSNGTKLWYRDGKHDRDDGPAIEWFTGTRKWYRNNVLHRDDGPAVEKMDGSKEWWQNGKHVAR